MMFGISNSRTILSGAKISSILIHSDLFLKSRAIGRRANKLEIHWVYILRVLRILADVNEDLLFTFASSVEKEIWTENFLNKQSQCLLKIGPSLCLGTIQG